MLLVNLVVVVTVRMAVMAIMFNPPMLIPLGG